MTASRTWSINMCCTYDDRSTGGLTWSGWIPYGVPDTDICQGVARAKCGCSALLGGVGEYSRWRCCCSRITASGSHLTLTRPHLTDFVVHGDKIDERSIKLAGAAMDHPSLSRVSAARPHLW
jgi:hypothetical protein